MPTNIGDAPLDGLKIGQAAIPKAYVGIDQIFPNTTEITAAAFDNASITNAAQNTDYTVAGEIGSSFTLTGSPNSGATGPVGTQVLSSSPTTYSIAIGDNSTCGNAARTPTIVIAPIGSTVLASGLSNTDTINQAAGPSPDISVISISQSVTNTVYNTVTIGGTVYWAGGAKWTISYNVSSITGAAIYTNDLQGLGFWGRALTPSTYGNYTITNAAGPTGVTGVNWDSSYENAYWTWTGAMPTGSYSYDIELDSGEQHSYMQFGGLINVNPSACHTISNNSGGASYISGPTTFYP
mgnify:CR=1 FL=1